MQMRSTLLCVHCEKNRCDTETQKNGQLSKVAPPESLGLASSPVADLFFAFFYGRPTFRAKLGSSSWSELPPFVANVEQLPRGAQKKTKKKLPKKENRGLFFPHSTFTPIIWRAAVAEPANSGARSQIRYCFYFLSLSTFV